jgi:23S rRNA pseudouridine1911/1915/1917 synthase
VTGSRSQPAAHCFSSVTGLFDIVFEDDELLVINKPAGLVCHPTKTDEFSSLISRVRLYLGAEARPHLVNRLDRETSGITVVAKTDEAARELRKLWERPACAMAPAKVLTSPAGMPAFPVEKEYIAIVHGVVSQEHGLIEAAVGKDEQSKVAIKDCVRADGAPAATEFWTESKIRDARFSLLRLMPRTGRKHQIRIHLAHLGHPIVGDKLYGGDEDLYLALVEDRLTAEQRERLMLPHHALHARQVRFPWRGTEMAFRAEPEEWFVRFLSG